MPPDHGGPPGQTTVENLGPMTGFHHRIKTHGRWQVKQPFPGIYLWRDPHGRMYLVDHTGTRKLGRTAPGPGLPDITPAAGRSRREIARTPHQTAQHLTRAGCPRSLGRT